MKKIRKYYLILILFVLLVFSVLFFHKNKVYEQDTYKKIKIGVSVVNFEEKFQSYIKSGIEKHHKTLGHDVDITYLDAKWDILKQKEQIKYFIDQGVDAIIITLAGSRDSSGITEMAFKSKIPLIYVNVFPDEFIDKELPENIYYVGSKEKEAGELQMKYLAEKLSGNGNIAVLMGDFSYTASFERTEGLEERALEYPGIKIIEKKGAKWLKPLASSIVEEWLISGRKIDAIAANNDEMAVGAIKTLKKYNKTGEILVAGIDATGEALSELESGTLSCTVFQDSNAQGKVALEIALQVASGEVAQNISWIPFRLVTQENYEKVISE